MNYPEHLSLPLPKELLLDLVLVQGGPFMMGDDNSQYAEEKPAHTVELSSFYIGKYPITQAQWEAVMKKNPANFKGENRPVENISWEDCQKFAAKMNALPNLKKALEAESIKGTFRLPREAEWEYAARGGIYSQGYTYAGSDKLKQVGWYEDNSGNQTQEVGKLLANELGLYDMSGNVWEWCEDWFDENYYRECLKKGTVNNPVGPPQGVIRVLRGGCYFVVALRCRAVFRYGYLPGYRSVIFGCRLVLALQ